MDRLSKPRPGRVLTASFAYKFLAGYSKQEGLALSWLLVLVLLVFTALFFFISTMEHRIIHAIVTATASDVTRVDTANKKMRTSTIKDALVAASDARRLASAKDANKPDRDAVKAAADAAQAAADATQSSATAVLAGNTVALNRNADQLDASAVGESDAWGTDPAKAVRLARLADASIWGSVPPDDRNKWHGKSDGLATALSSSLHASNFLGTQSEGVTIASFAGVSRNKKLILLEAMRHICVGAERLAVLAQITLLFICLRSRFLRAL